MKSSAAWKPILEGQAKEAAAKAVQEIAYALRQPLPIIQRIADVPTGQAGLAIFFAYLARFTGHSADLQSAQQALNSALHIAAEEELGSTLFWGYPGVIWGAQHLARQSAVLPLAIDAEDLCTQADQALVQGLSSADLDTSSFHYAEGLVGLGIYFLDRLPSPMAVEGLELVVGRLSQMAIRTPQGFAWMRKPEELTPRQRQLMPQGCFDLGMVRGVAGVIALLGEICRVGVAQPAAAKLLDGAVSWFLSMKCPPGEVGVFGAMIAPGHPPKQTRLGWCYGDLGAAVALLLAAAGRKDESWRAEALALARLAALRTLENGLVEDAGFCHGAAGIGHLFNRLYQSSGDDTFRQVALTWIARALCMKQTGTGLAGYQCFYDNVGDGVARWHDNPGVLMGVAGIGLVFLAAITDVEPDWDSYFLCRLPADR